MNSQPLNVPASWRRIKLKYLVALKSGDAIPGEEIKELGEYPVYGGNGFRGYTNSFTHEGERILIGRQGALCGNTSSGSAGGVPRRVDQSSNRFP